MISPQNSRRLAFTLVELLVAIALVLILAAVLSSVFGLARAQAKSIACTHNLKQIAAAAAAFSADNNGAIVPYAQNQPHVAQKYKNVFWYGMVYYYLYPNEPWTNVTDSIATSRRKPFFCPSTDTLYAINRICGWANGSNPSISPWKSFLRIGQGIADKSHRNVEGTGWNTSLRPFPLPGTLAETAYFADGSAAFTPETISLKFPHRERCNVLYMDGHVAQISDPDFVKNAELVEEREWINFFGRRPF